VQRLLLPAIKNFLTRTLVNNIGISYSETQCGMPRGASLQTIEKVAIIFDVAARGAQGISRKELSAKGGLQKGTAYPLLSSLDSFGYVRQVSESKNYQLGSKLVELGNRLLDKLDLRAQGRPSLINLCKRTRETGHLVVLDQDKALHVAKVESDEKPGWLQMFSRVGLRMSLKVAGLKYRNNFVVASGPAIT
jgi:IclR family KDG regulon transcriptional repressor